MPPVHSRTHPSSSAPTSQPAPGQDTTQSTTLQIPTTSSSSSLKRERERSTTFTLSSSSRGHAATHETGTTHIKSDKKNTQKRRVTQRQHSTDITAVSLSLLTPGVRGAPPTGPPPVPLAPAAPPLPAPAPPPPRPELRWLPLPRGAPDGCSAKNRNDIKYTGQDVITDTKKQKSPSGHIGNQKHTGAGTPALSHGLQQRQLASQPYTVSSMPNTRPQNNGRGQNNSGGCGGGPHFKQRSGERTDQTGHSL